ncbi:MAG TPA: hypothetical protein VH309_13460, partial [Elusimicrobiota bacterium]|nr:hypothetical protein [Elusimicrobiota bacterium]
PYVSGVGGTTLTGSLSSHGEEVWNEGCNSPGTDCSAGGAGGGAGGGGIANYCEKSGSQVSCATSGATAYFALPSWQTGVSGEASTSYRNVPDVTLNADPDAFPYVVSVAGNFYYIGGTSAAAPLWAALTALINENRATGGYGTLGFANPYFYELGTGSSYATYFNDIKTGGNGGYNAGTGYDNASGWGSFKGNALVNILSAPLAPTSAVTGLTSYSLGVSSIQYSWTALAGATGYDVAYATNSSVYLAHAVQPPYDQTGLIGDEVSGLAVYGENDGTEGPVAFITTATFAAAPAAAPTATGQFSSSATFSYSACPASPSPSFCSGYFIQVSPNANFSAPTFSSATTSRTLTTLAVTGLSPVTGYFMRLANLNSLGAPSYGPSGTFNTGTNLVAPVSPYFSQVASNSLTFNWGQSTNPNGTTYVAQASTAANYSGTLLTQTGTALSAAFSGLSADTSYYFQVQGVGGPELQVGPEATLAAAPTALANSFSSVGAAALTASWSGANDQPDTLYQADVSPTANFSSGVISQQERATAATFSGLTANTAYYARVEAIGRLGGTTAEVPLGSTTTLVNAPSIPGLPFSGLTSSGFTFSFDQDGNPAGTNYVVNVATTPNFAPIDATANTTSAGASFTGLQSNQLYYAEVASLNQSGSPSAYAVSGATVTFAVAPLAAAIPVTTQTTTRFGFAWSAGTLAPGTTYLAEVSSSPVFAAGFVLTTSTTPNASETFSGLLTNTTYYGRVQVQTDNFNPDSAFLSAAAAATLANAPSSAGPAFSAVAYTSATVAWTPLPLAPPGPPSSAAEGYLVQLDTAPDFSGVNLASAVAPGAQLATVAGLGYATQYYARVGSLNWDGLTNYFTLGSTVTLQPALSSGTVGATGVALAVPSSFPQFSAISVLVPPGSFPAGTPISAVANFAALPPPVTNEAASIVPFGTNVGLVLDANGLQPNSPVTIAMTYDPTQIPAGQNAARLQLWRYDPLAQQWTLIPSQVDTVGHVLTAQTPHFSTFAPFFVAAGSDVSSVQVWPQPWELGDATSQFWSSALNFSNLPPSASVKIFTITGELVWSGTAAADGTLNWDGNNRFG